MPHPNPKQPYHRCVKWTAPGDYASCDKCKDIQRDWMLDGEEWREIPGVPGYLASSLGRVKHASPGRKPAKPVPNKQGYGRVWTGIGSRETKLRRSVHSLVALAFIGPRPDGTEINHIDGNRLNNVPGNLEYITHTENIRHSLRMGTHHNCRLGYRLEDGTTE